MKHLVTVILVACLVLLSVSATASLESEARSKTRSDLDTLQELLDGNDTSRAIEHAERAYRDAFATLNPDDRLVLDLINMYVGALSRVGSQAEAITVVKDLIERIETDAGVDNYVYLEAMVLLGGMQPRKDQVATFRKALEVHETYFPRAIEAHAQLCRIVGTHLAEYPEHRYEALKLLSVALPGLEHAIGPNYVQLIGVHMGIGQIHAELEAAEIATKSFERAFAIAKHHGDTEQHAFLLLLAGEYLTGLDESVEAKNFLTESLAQHEQIYGMDDLRTARARVSLADYHMYANEPTDAEQLLLTALATYELDGEQQTMQTDTMIGLVEVYEDLGRRDEATKYCLKIGQQRSGDSGQDYLPLLKKPATYPPDAVKNNEEGYVIVEYIVDENGIVQSPRVVESTGTESFHPVSIEASYEFRYAPRFVDGKPVATPGVRNKFTFKLEP